jgi:hypothetical protein
MQKRVEISEQFLLCHLLYRCEMNVEQILRSFLHSEEEKYTKHSL